MAPEFSPERGTPASGPQGITPQINQRDQAHATVESPLRARVIEAPDPYDEARNQVIYNGEVDIFEARQTAYSWHGGQDSPLYSFASTGAIVHDEDHRAGLEGEIQHNIDWVISRPDDDSFFKERTKTEELDALDNLMRTVKALPTKNPSTDEEGA